MEEHTSVEVHLKKMHGILTVELEYEMINALANNVVLHSLPPNYRVFVERRVLAFSQLENCDMII
jgi:hypothetical protein